MSSSARRFPLWRIPIILAALTLLGLFDALLIDNVAARAFAWLVLVVPIIAAIRCVLGAYKPSDSLN